MNSKYFQYRYMYGVVALMITELRRLIRSTVRGDWWRCRHRGMSDKSELRAEWKDAHAAIIEPWVFLSAHRCALRLSAPF